MAVGDAVYLGDRDMAAGRWVVIAVTDRAALPHPSDVAQIHREAMQKIKALMTSTASQIRPMLTPEQQKKLDDNQNARRGRMNARKGPRDEEED